MREQIRKPINNQDLYDGAAEAFRRGWRKVKLYFMCGLPGERPADLDGIVEMAETIARIGKDVTGRFADVQASVSNFVPKPHTALPVERDARTRECSPLGPQVPPISRQASSVKVKCLDIELRPAPKAFSRGDRLVAEGVEEASAALRGRGLDAWSEYFDPGLWWATFADLGIDVPPFCQPQATAFGQLLLRGTTSHTSRKVASISPRS